MRRDYRIPRNLKSQSQIVPEAHHPPDTPMNTPRYNTAAVAYWYKVHATTWSVHDSLDKFRNGGVGSPGSVTFAGISRHFCCDVVTTITTYAVVGILVVLASLAAYSSAMLRERCGLRYL